MLNQLKIKGLFVAGILLNILFSVEANAQIEMADKFREDGKIYVVVTTIGLILAGIFVFLIWLERRLSTLEKHSKTKVL